MRRLLAALGMVLGFGVHAQETIKIGVITDRVGVSKPYSEPSTEGLIFGASEVNRKGGILGRKIELLIEDDQSRPDISAALARKLIDQGAVFILSMSLTPATQQQQTVTLEAKTPQMTPMNSGDTLTTQLPNPYFWQTGPLGSIQIAIRSSLPDQREKIFFGELFAGCCRDRLAPRAPRDQPAFGAATSSGRASRSSRRTSSR